MPLDNPTNDASAMTMARQESGFEVITVLDADLKTMQQSMLDFAALINRNSTALVFYAGHGMQAKGHNYLLLLDAMVETENALRYAALDLSDVLADLEEAGARANIVILDACRNNPFEKKSRGGSRGLVAVDAARGTCSLPISCPNGTSGKIGREVRRALQL